MKAFLLHRDRDFDLERPLPANESDLCRDLELNTLFEETLARFPAMELAGGETIVESVFVNQLKTLPVRLSPA